MRLTDVLVLIPAWNEGERIGAVLSDLPKGMPVLVVDDGSSDATLQIAKAAGAHTIAHAENKGKGVALMTGFSWGIAQGFPGILTLDADGQHDPTEAPKFLEAFERHKSDLIIGRRSLKDIPFPRNFANRFGSWLLSQALHQDIYDNQSGYRFYARSLLEKLELRRQGFEFEVDVIIQALQSGFELGWVDIRTIYDESIKSHFHPIRDTYRFFAVAWYAYNSYRRAPVVQNDVAN